MERARAVVIGGGVTGCSVAYHLAKAGWRDVLLVEKGQLTSGSTHHAAGLVTQFNASSAMLAFRRYSVELYRALGVFAPVGSVRIASSHDSLLDLRRAASRVAAAGLDVTLISAAEVLELLPQATAEGLFGGVWIPTDGYVDPHIATHALADAARALGVDIRLRSRITGIELGSRREVRTVHTDKGPIECECVVDAAGIWAPQIAAMVGAFIPSVPVDHQHVTMQAVAGHELARDAPCFRDPDNLVYGRAEAGGMLIGGYEPDPRSRWVDGVPWEHGGQPVESDMDRFAPLLEGAIRRFPYLERAGVMRLLCHPDAMTPDGNPLLGPLPGVRGFWVAAGLSLNGFGGAGGIGRSLAEWITAGGSEVDVHAYRAWRFGRVYADANFAAAKAREAYRYYYRLRYPLDSSTAARGRRMSPLHARLAELGAVFGSENGWERADRLEPGERSRCAGEEQRRFGWRTPPYLARLADEHAAFRERVGIVDLTASGTIAVCGPGAVPLLERVCANRIDRDTGSVVHTQLLSPAAGVVGDLRVTRLDHHRFRLVTGAGAVDSDLGWLRLHVRAGDPVVELRDETDEVAVIGICGPRAGELLAAVAQDGTQGAAPPCDRARTIAVGPARVLVQPLPFLGELGWELHVAPEWAVQVWDRLMAAGRAFGIRAGGHRVLDSLRIEKGYRRFASDLTPSDTPYEAGVGFCVAESKERFVGAEALAAARERGPRWRLRTLLVGDGGYQQLYGGEPVRLDRDVVGSVRSCAFGFSVGCHVALAAVPPDLGSGSRVTVDALGEPVPATVAADVLYDPENARLRDGRAAGLEGLYRHEIALDLREAMN